MNPVRNDLFDSHAGYDRGRPTIVFAMWYVVRIMFFESLVPWPPPLRTFLLRCFGAEIGVGLRTKPGISIHLPWKLRVGDHCWIGDHAVILNLAPVTIGNHVTISHQAYLAAAGHDPNSRTMLYRNRPIVLADGCWVATRAYVGPGVSVGSHALVAAGAVVVADVGAETIVGGNPAQIIGHRIVH